MKPLSSTQPVSDAFRHRFTECAATAGPDDRALPFREFMRLSLYDPDVGYYRAKRQRVGTGAGTDFYTASHLRMAFAPLLVAAAERLLGDEPASAYIFVEIGGEPGRAILDGVSHPFAAVRTIGVGEPVKIAGRTVVFSNELFDAQPFTRVVFRDGAWREAGVRLAADRLDWCELPEFSSGATSVRDRLPGEAPEGYIVDLPLNAEILLRGICQQPWTGLFLTFDYGREWRTLSTEYPYGTGRGYRAHRHAESLLDAPGKQDLTCHVCWDWLEAVLRETGFSEPRRSGQEAFLIHHATAAISTILAGNPSPVSPARSQLKQLLHPALMGQRFEALWAVRQ